MSTLTIVECYRKSACKGGVALLSSDEYCSPGYAGPCKYRFCSLSHITSYYFKLASFEILFTITEPRYITVLILQGVCTSTPQMIVTIDSALVRHAPVGRQCVMQSRKYNTFNLLYFAIPLTSLFYMFSAIHNNNHRLRCMH
jgi:hypothetical protein